MDLYWLHLLLNQYESGLHEDFMRWFLNAFWSGKLCTACMSGFLKSAKEMGFLAPVVREENVYKEAKLRCGESFGGMCSTNFTSALTQGDGPYEGRKTPTTELAQATAPVGSATSGALLRTLPLSYVFASVLFGAWLSGSMDLM